MREKICIIILVILAFFGLLQITNAVVGTIAWHIIDGEPLEYGIIEYANNLLPYDYIIDNIRDIIEYEQHKNDWHVCMSKNDPLPCDEIGYDDSNI